MNMTYYLDGKRVDEKPKNSKLVRTVSEKYFEIEEYSKKREVQSIKNFNELRQMRENSEAYHG